MNPKTAVRPHRSLVLPLLVVAVPALYFVYRDAAIGCPPGRTCLELAHFGTAAGALAVTYLVAGVALAAADASALADRSALARVAFRPTDRTLAVLAVLVAGLAAYLLASAATTIPGWLDAALTPVGLLVGLPLLVVTVVLITLGNAVGEPSLAVQSAVVAAGLAATGAWLFVLATGTAGFFGSWLPSKIRSR
ncbi:hypothetical protein M0R88_00015 [Halorussus gelatinilyticus]|uniref:Uncharacterized protein n=1 Tax=Halorussus gelatinilyticus TaxID=2937524 RepID=A0A8U0III5_9EURY|nr:hypothetical protein [Halorussus gelatinilyticus]UPW00505.1 hypothetical protein M0R88_00015 [Halorussus gelatinilyticus]